MNSPDVAAGTWSVEALGNYSVVEPGFVTVSRAREHERVRITVAMTPPGSSIGGIVVDEVGSPVADIDVTVMEQDITGRRVHGDCTTDARGRFRMQVKGNTQEVLSIQSIDPKKRFLASTHHGPFAIGKSDIVVRISRGHSAKLRVLDAATLAPVERFRVRMYPNIGSVVDPKRKEYPNGDVDLPHVKYDKATVVIEAEDPDYLPAGPLTLQLGGNALVIKPVLLHRAAKLLVRVNDARGGPVEDAQVFLLDARGGDPSAEHLPTLHLNELSIVSILEVRSHAVVLASGTTDSAGNLTILVRRAGSQSSTDHLFVQVTRDGFVPSVLRLADLRAAGGTVRLQRGTTLICRAVGSQRWTHPAPASPGGAHQLLLTVSKRIDPRLAGHGLEVVLERSVPILERQLFEFDKSGEAIIRGLPQGRCTVNYVFRSRNSNGVCKIPVARDLELGPGTERIVEFDLGQLLEQPVSLRVLLDGQPASRLSLDAFWCASAKDTNQTLVVSAQTDVAGWVRTKLPVGSYRFRLRDDVVGEPTATVFVSEKTYEVVPKNGTEESSIAVLFRRRAVTLRLTARNREGFAANRRITVISGTMFKRTVTTGPGGTVRLPNAPGGPFYVQIMCNFRRDAEQPWSEKARSVLQEDRIRNAFGIWVDSGLRLGPFQVPATEPNATLIAVDASSLFLE